MLEETELSVGEKVALKAGKDVSTKEQFAVCYLVAKGHIKRLRESGISDNLALESGMKPETYRRAVNKFKLLIEGKQEDEDETAKEQLYVKIINCFEHFKNMSVADLVELGMRSFTEAAHVIGTAYYNKAQERQAASSIRQKEKRSKLENDILSYVFSYSTAFQKTGQSIHDSRKKAKHLAAKHFEKKISEINKICDSE